MVDIASSKHGYVLFYVSFIAILLFFSAEMGQSIISVSGSEEQLLPPVLPDTENTLIDSLTFIFNLVVFAVITFGTLIFVSTEFLVLFIFVVLPLTFGFAWCIYELARGN